MRSLEHVTESDKANFWSKVVVKDGCWEWTGAIRAKGYAAAYSQHLQREIGAHRISWVIHNGPIPDGLFVCHHCDNPRCTNPEHLFLGTCKDNCHDMMQKGRQSFRPPGSANPQAKLTEEQVIEMRQRWANGESAASLARHYGSGGSVVRRILRREKWKHIP